MQMSSLLLSEKIETADCRLARNRLRIEYAMLAALVVMLGVAFAGWQDRVKLEKQVSELQLQQRSCTLPKS